ncbi:MAG: metallophosphoesterase [Hyphomicrobiales bacterium]
MSIRPLSLAIVSDLHIGSKACTPDLRGQPISGRRTFLDQFSEFIKTNAIAADFLVLPGDMSEIADPHEFDKASNLVEAVASELKVKSDSVFFVPGNHDVDWSVLKQEVDGKAQPIHPVRWGQRYDGIRNSANVFAKSLSCGTGTYFEQPHFAYWQKPEVVCVGYNSSWHDKPGQQHTGNINLDDLAQLSSRFDELRLQDFHGVKIFLVHHHVLQYAQVLWEDVSIAQNAEALLDVLEKFKFDLLVHGHRHIPRFQILKRNDLHPEHSAEP